MRYFLRFLVVLFSACGVFAQQPKVREVDSMNILRQHVQDVDRTRFVKGYYGFGDGGGGMFIFTNTILSTNLGTRFQVTGQNYSWERVHDGLVNVRWFGAKGDGVTLDHVAIQAAIDYCEANGFTVVIPKGTFLVNTVINLKDNTRMIGTSPQSVVSAVALSITMTSSGKTNIVLSDFQFGGTSATQLKILDSQNVRLSNIYVTGAVQNFGSLTAGIWVEGGSDITLDNVHWFGNGLAAGVNATDYNLVVNFNGGVTTNLVILNPEVDNLNSKCGLCMFGVIDLQIVGGTVNMNNKGTAADNNGYAILSYGQDGVPNLRTTVTGTTITNTYGSAVYFRNTIGGLIGGLNISAASQLQGDFSLPVGAIVVNIASDIKVLGNGITNSSINSGIVMCLTTNCVVGENTIDLSGTNHFAIELRGENFGTSIKGNSMTAGHRGIGTSLGAGNNIVGGDIEGNSVINYLDGISIGAGSSNTVIRANRVFNNGNAAILDLGSYNTIAHNQLIGGLIGIYAAGTDGLILPNAIQGQITGLNILGTGYRVDLIGRYHDNTTPINDAGGAVVKFLTVGTTPSVEDSPSYFFNYAAPTTITDFTDGLIGFRRTFFTANTNVTIQHSSAINLDGAGDFNMKNGDTLTLEKNASGGWREVGRSINDDYIYVNRAGEQVIVNWPVFDFNTYYQQTTPSTTTYASDHIISTNTTGLALIARWAAFGNLNGFTIKTSSDNTNYLFGFNGTEYQFPITNALAGQILASSGGVTNFLYWTNSSGGGGVYTFDPTQFSSAGGSVAITNFATVTNMFLKGATRGGPNLNVSGVNIDASLGTEFSKTLASNTTMGIINMTNDQTIHVAFTNTTFTLSFTNTEMTWISSVVPVINTNAVNVFHFHKKGDWIWASDPEQVANANIVALAAMAGTGVLVKTNASTIVTFDPLPIRYGGTGTNAFSTIANGDVLFYNLTQDSMDVDDAQFLYSKSQHTLYLNRTTPTGGAQLVVAEGSGGVPILSLFANRISEGNDDLTLEVGSGYNLLVKNNAVTALTVSSNLSTIIGDGTTTTTRTNKFIYLPSTAGTPTGVPTTVAGTYPVVWDSSNNHLYLYDAGWIQLDGSGGVINATDGVMPYRSSATTFADSPIRRIDATTISLNGITNFLTTLNASLIYSNLASAPLFLVKNSIGTATFGLNAGGSTFIDSASGGIYIGADMVAEHIKPSIGDTFDIGSSASANQFRDLYLSQRVVWNGSTNTVFDRAGSGTPEGAVTASIGSLYRRYDGGASTTIYAKTSGTGNTGWTAIGSGGGGGAPVGTMVASGISTTGIVPATSDTTGTNYIASPLIVSAVTNILQRGRNEVNLIQSTNGVVPLDVAVSKLIRTASNNKLAAVTIGGGLTFDGTTLDVAGGGALAGSGTPTYYAQWTGSAALGDGGLYHIDSTAVGLGSTNFFLHTHGGLNNLGIGEFALQNIDGGGTANIAIGRSSQAGTTTGDNNVSIGEGSLQVLATGDKNVAVGNGSLAAATSNGNSMFGYRSGNAITTSTNNAGGGYLALNFTTTGRFNSAWGGMSGFDNLSGSYNTYLGAESGYFDGNGALTFTNTSQVGFGSLATNDNAVVLGNQNVTRWQLGNNGPTIKRGTGSPQSVVNGNVGDIFIRTDGGVNTVMYWKESGAGTTTGWVTKGGSYASVARLHVESAKLPGTNPARINPVSDYLWELLFDPTTSQSGGWSFVMPQDYGSSLQVRFKTVVKSAQTGVKGVVYRFYVAAMKATEDPTAPTFSSANSVTVTLANNQAANQIVESTVTLTNADSVVAGDLVVIKVDRDATNGTDDAAGDSALEGSVSVEWLKQ